MTKSQSFDTSWDLRIRVDILQLIETMFRCHTDVKWQKIFWKFISCKTDHSMCNNGLPVSFMGPIWRPGHLTTIFGQHWEFGLNGPLVTGDFFAIFYTTKFITMHGISITWSTQHEWQAAMNSSCLVLHICVMKNNSHFPSNTFMWCNSLSYSLTSPEEDHYFGRKIILKTFFFSAIFHSKTAVSPLLLHWRYCSLAQWYCFTNTVFTKIIRHVGHFRWLGPNVWWEIS